jgi:hypothetical protein
VQSLQLLSILERDYELFVEASVKRAKGGDISDKDRGFLTGLAYAKHVVELAVVESMKTDASATAKRRFDPNPWNTEGGEKNPSDNGCCSEK